MAKKKKRTHRLVIKAAEQAYVRSLEHKTINEIAADIKLGSKSFLVLNDWQSLRARVIEKYGTRCMCCGRKPRKLQNVNIDHIKPRKLFPHLALEFDNLQVLCGRCNKEKGNKDFTDYRPVSLVTLLLG